MNRLEAFHIFLIAFLLAAFAVMPSMADDIAQPTTQAGEPVYVWQGNQINNQQHPDAQQRAENHQAAFEGMPPVPQPKQAGAVSYITGGIGEEERDAMYAVKKDYNVFVTSTNANGEYNGDTQITIRDDKGAELMSATAGPLFYVRLPAGRYTVEAANSGVVKNQKIAIGGEKSSSVYFRW